MKQAGERGVCGGAPEPAAFHKVVCMVVSEPGGQ